MSASDTLGRFVIDTARGSEKTQQMPAQDAEKISRELSDRVGTKVEEIRTSQRRAYEESKTITVF